MRQRHPLLTAWRLESMSRLNSQLWPLTTALTVALAMAVYPIVRFAPRRISAVIFSRTLVSPLFALALLGASLLAMRLTAPSWTGSAAALFGAVSIATFSGSLLGWFVPPRRSDLDLPLSPAYPLIRLRAHDVPTLAPLTHWVAAQTAQWLQPSPLNWRGMAFAIVWRPLLQQLQWALLATVLLLALRKATHAAHA